MSWKDDYIVKYGEEAYARRLMRSREWEKINRKKRQDAQRKWCQSNSEKVKERSKQANRKNGKYYEKKQKYMKTGIQGERERVRDRDGYKWRSYKKIIAPESVLHHQWCSWSSQYDGVALVEKNKHQHGFIDVIQILGGRITLFTEKDIRGGTGI